MKILQLNSSARAEGSGSTRLAETIVARLKMVHPDAVVETRDLVKEPLPPLDDIAVASRFTPADSRTPAQTERGARDAEVVAQLLAADVIVIGAPMYNFNIPTHLKNWIDAIAKPGVTFRYTPNGPIGLVSGKKVYVALTRGGFYRDTPDDMPANYLRYFFKFIGITDVSFVYAEGMTRGPEMTAKAFADAEAQIARLVA